VRIFRPILSVATAAVLFLALLIAAPSALANKRDIVVWVPKGFKPAASAALPAAVDGHRVRILVRDMSNLAERLLSGNPQNAPDVLFIDASRTGDLASAALVSPIELDRGTRRTLIKPAVDGFRFGFNIYGVPMQTQNVAMVTNADLVPQAPQTFRQLRRFALQLQRQGRVSMPLALGQDPSSPAAEALYPLFAGLGGFVFGTNAGGSLDPTKVGIDNAAFRKNSGQIDTWNATGLLNSAITTKQAREAFLAGRAPFWIAAPTDISDLTKVTFRYRISAVPRIVKGQRTSPLMRSHGFAVTTFARQHNVLAPARKLVTEVAPGARAQRAFAEASPLVGLPANRNAAANVANRQLVAFGAAAGRAVPYPNISQWGPASIAWLDAWRASTRGVDAEPAAVPAAESFAAARTAVRQGGRSSPSPPGPVEQGASAGSR
jgi:arabinogalactan oligomer/maltooligosaccharide transport system substrate-binding protein